MPVAAVLLDIAGVLHDGNAPYPGALDAVSRLRQAGLPVRFVTNTSRRTRAATLRRLVDMGFDVDAEQIFTAPLAARHYLESRGLRPLLVIHPDLADDFREMNCEDPNAVFIADAGEYFSYTLLDPAFRLLLDGAPLIAVGRNRYFRDAGQLHLDAGPFVAALEFASGQTAIIAGKPSAEFYGAVVDDLDIAPADVIMIGDDVEADVLGAVQNDMAAILVQTGKYQDGDQQRLSGSPARLAANLPEAVDWILAQ
ncbi:MAG: TIGR01458 family HAD-type hydrolase [Gammaproteobacteria bacterium]|nr:TIGR01458 family HAD-type hydrolase [Gammaproteobacteria bacterium]